MRARLMRTELYPVYRLAHEIDTAYKEVEVEPSLLSEYVDALEKFYDVLDRLEDIVEAQ